MLHSKPRSASVRSQIGKDCVELGDTFHVSLAVAAHTVHGMSKSAEFPTWRGMRPRCDNRADPAYHNYGGRGISYCPRRAEFDNFLQGHESFSATLFRFPFTGDGSFLPGVPFCGSRGVRSTNGPDLNGYLQACTASLNFRACLRRKLPHPGKRVPHVHNKCH